MQAAELESLLGRLRASQFHLQGSAQRGMDAHSTAMLRGPGNNDNEAAIVRC